MDPQTTSTSSPAVSATNTNTKYISNPFALIKPSYEAAKINWKPLLLSFLALFAAGFLGSLLVPLITNVVQDQAALAVIVVSVTVLALAALFLLVAPSMALIALASARHQKITLKSAVAKGLPYIWRLVGVGILTALAVGAGIALLIIPGIIFAAWFSLASWVVLDEDLE